ncbi:hypothetical protein ACFX5Q_17225 [Mesorhizobium sp. IMUNJ 23033]|uniref:hypothetical protein n=1 Tax=Mesorhizobium sp. IMUNJ 23033 TaxID=3378039 RepID=UPI00384CC3DD
MQIPNGQDDIPMPATPNKQLSQWLQQVTAFFAPMERRPGGFAALAETAQGL